MFIDENERHASHAQRAHVEDEAVSRAAGITSHRLIHVCQETQDDAKSTLTVQDSIPQGIRSPSRYELHVAIIIQGTDNGSDFSTTCGRRRQHCCRMSAVWNSAKSVGDSATINHVSQASSVLLRLLPE